MAPGDIITGQQFSGYLVILIMKFNCCIDCESEGIGRRNLANKQTNNLQIYGWGSRSVPANFRHPFIIYVSILVVKHAVIELSFRPPKHSTELFAFLEQLSVPHLSTNCCSKIYKKLILNVDGRNLNMFSDGLLLFQENKGGKT